MDTCTEQVCSRCKRVRKDKYLIAKVMYGKTKIRCRKRSVCSSIARRNKLGRGPNSVKG